MQPAQAVGSALEIHDPVRRGAALADHETLDPGSAYNIAEFYRALNRFQPECLPGFFALCRAALKGDEEGAIARGAA
jgi:hypothetical protein